MRRIISVLLISLVWTLGLLAQQEEQNPQTNMEDMAKAMQQLSEAMQKASPVEPVNFRTLKALLPKELPGMKRTSAEGSKTSAMGVKVSQAEATYTNKDGGTIHIQIMDMGSMKDMVGMAMAGWAMAEYDRETDTGYERTLDYKGNKAMEEWDNEAKSGKISVLVANRFVVEVEGDGVDMRTIKAALDKIDLKKLASMKNEGVGKTK
jgi:hypothetical protein